MQEPKRLLILRHAKSDHPFGISDHDREISEKGKSDCILIGNWLKANIKQPELILCSSSKRTRMTLKAIQKQTHWTSEIDYLDELYLPYKQEIFDVVSKFNKHAKSILLIGHNPGFTEFYNTLSVNILDNLPTSGFAEFEIQNEWDELAFNKFKNTAFQIPKNLR